MKINFELVKYNPPYLLKKFPLIRKLFISSVKDHLLKNKSPPSFIITTGKRMAGVSIALKFILKDKVITIHIQNPKISRNQFDLLLIPEHDAITGKNIIQTKGALSFFLNQEIKNKKNLTTEKPIIFLMVGGRNKRYNPKSIDYYDLGIKAVKASNLLNAKLIISTSRRTGIKAEKILKSIFSKKLNDFKFYTFNSKNPYPNILQKAQYLIVTSDSVSMVSEMATISTPLFVSFFPLRDGFYIE